MFVGVPLPVKFEIPDNGAPTPTEKVLIPSNFLLVSFLLILILNSSLLFRKSNSISI